MIPGSATSRRQVLFAIPLALAGSGETVGEEVGDPGKDPWHDDLVELANEMNRFIGKYNAGKFDLKGWRGVVAQVEKLDGRKPCRP